MTSEFTRTHQSNDANHADRARHHHDRRAAIHERMSARHERFAEHHGRGHRGDGPLDGPEFGHRRGHRHGSRGRAQRGDVRTAVLLLLADQPMHGYQLMQAMAERSSGAWRPSPGAIYPTLSQLRDEGLISLEAESGRKLATLTDSGRAYVTANRESWADPFAELAASTDGGKTDLRGLVGQLLGAVRQVSISGSDEQVKAAAKLLTDTRRSLYLLLADGPDADAASDAS